MAEQDWLQELPEAYRDPARIKDALAHVQELEAESGRYKDFYEKSYMPWVKEHGTNFQEYTRDAEDEVQALQGLVQPGESAAPLLVLGGVGREWP